MRRRLALCLLLVAAAVAAAPGSATAQARPSATKVAPAAGPKPAAAAPKPAAAAPKPAAAAHKPAAAAPKAAPAAPRAAPAGLQQGYDGTVAFQGSALLITYYSGVSQALVERRVVVPGKTPLAGLSGGAFTAVSLALGKTGQQMLKIWKAMIKACTAKEFGGSCAGRLNGIMPALLAKYLPDDANSTVSGLVSIALSQFNGASSSLANSASWITDRFPTKSDLVAALTASDYIPCWTGLTLFTYFRANPVGDGGFANGFEQLCAKSKGKCLKVSCYYVGPLGNGTCDPARCPTAAQSNCTDAERTGTVTKLYKNDPLVDRQELFQLIQRCTPEAWPGQAPYPLPPFIPHNQTGFYPDIHPGVFNPLPQWDGKPLLTCQWHDWALQLPKGREEEAMDVAYALGYKDGLAWASTNGFPA